ncbi:MAG: rhodanese-like domain-containing protein [bacterium]
MSTDKKSLLTEDPRVSLTAERTFLAWIRTGLALMGFGLHYVPASVALCLLVCSCSKERNVHGERRGAFTGSNLMSNGESQVLLQPIIIDTRTPEEYAGGHLDGALLMPYDGIGGMIEAKVPDKNTPIMLYCRSGGRAETARKTLAAMNYTSVENLGGIQAAADRLKKKVVK